MGLCTGCRNCELACSVRNTRSFTPSRSRIQILKDEPRSIIAPVVCLQCDEPLCRNACPSGAIAENDFGTLTVNQEACIGCMNCVTACVYGGIAMDNKTLKAVKCDLCVEKRGRGEAPACTTVCPTRCIFWGDPEAFPSGNLRIAGLTLTTHTGSEASAGSGTDHTHRIGGFSQI